jgi:hypothetical protein
MMISKERAIEIVNECIERIDTTKCRKLSVVEGLCNDDIDYPDYRVVCIAGGINGRGIWSNYLEILGKLMFQIELYFDETPMILNMENDVADDVFYVFIGIPKGNEE